MLNVRERMFGTVLEPIEQGNGLPASFCLRPCVSKCHSSSEIAIVLASCGKRISPKTTRRPSFQISMCFLSMFFRFKKENSTYAK